MVLNTQISLNLSSNVNGDSSNEFNFLCKLMLIDTQVSRLRKLLQAIRQLI